MRCLAVVAHPDDESFGLGAVLRALVDAGHDVDLLCLTHGEASTLGATADLGALRERELTEAAAMLGLRSARLESYRDGHLADVPEGELDALVAECAAGVGAVVVFEPCGVTGHPDHRAATAAAARVAARLGLDVVEWGVAPAVAEALGPPFVALEDGPGVVELRVDRAAQRRAIACHRTQFVGNPVVTRRLALQGDVERVRLRGPGRLGAWISSPPSARPSDTNTS